MPWPSEAIIDFTATGDNAVVAGVVNQVVKVFQLFLIVSADTTLTFKDGSGMDLTGPIAMLANGSIVLDFVRGSREADQPWFTTNVGNAVIINQTGSAQVSGRLYHVQGLLS